MILVAVLGIDCMRQWMNQGLVRRTYLVAIKVRNNIFLKFRWIYIRSVLYSVIMNVLKVVIFYCMMFKNFLLGRNTSKQTQRD